MRFYFKYCGWGAGQLDSEISDNAWYPISCSSDLLMADVSAEDPDAMWHSVMQLIDDDHRAVSDRVRSDARFK